MSETGFQLKPLPGSSFQKGDFHGELLKNGQVVAQMSFYPKELAATGIAAPILVYELLKAFLHPAEAPLKAETTHFTTALQEGGAVQILFQPERTVLFTIEANDADFARHLQLCLARITGNLQTAKNERRHTLEFIFPDTKGPSSPGSP